MNALVAAFGAVALVASFALLRRPAARETAMLLRVHAAASTLAILAGILVDGPPDRAARAVALALLLAQFVLVGRLAAAPDRTARSRHLATLPAIAGGLALAALAVLIVSSASVVSPPGVPSTGVQTLVVMRESRAIALGTVLVASLGFCLPGPEADRALRLLPLGNGLVLLAATIASASAASLIVPALLMPALALAASSILARASVLPTAP